MFGFLVSITQNSVSITYNSKIVGPMTQNVVWISITLFPVFVSITQFSDFWVMSYGNWKHILGVFSFHNSISNGILVIKHIWRDPLSGQPHLLTLFFFPLLFSSFSLLFFFFLPFHQNLVNSFFFFFFCSSSLGSGFFVLPFFFFFSFFFHWV